MHLTLIATALLSLRTIGYDNTILVGAVVGIYSSIGTTLAMIIKAKDQDLRNLSISCFISQFFGGVGEPTIFSIILRYKRTLILGMIGTFAGAFYAGLMDVAVYVTASLNFLDFLSFSRPNKDNIINGIIDA